MKTHSPLYDGILMSARSEADEILKQGEKSAFEIKKSYEKKIADAKEHEQILLHKKLEEIVHTEENLIKNMERSVVGNLIKELRKHAQKALNIEMASIVDTKEYKKALVEWIAEGAIALEAKSVQVATSSKETISDEMLTKAAIIVKKVVSREVEITRNPTPLSTQGVVVSTVDGKIAYNNSVHVRFMRLRSEFERVLEGAV